MNTKQENIQVDSCQYTPVYLVENTGAIQVFFVVYLLIVHTEHLLPILYFD